MAKRPERAPEEKLPEPVPAAAVPAGPAGPAQPAQPKPIEFRTFDPDRVDEEFVSAETQVQTAVANFESAKTVSARALNARVCL